MGEVVGKFASVKRAGAALALALIVSPAAAQVQQHIATCNDEKNTYTLDQRIASCTTVIESGTYTGTNLAITYMNRGNAYDDKGDHDRALSDYNRSVELNPKNARTYFNRALAYANKKDYDHAIADYGQAITLDPKYAHAYAGRGAIRYLKGDTETALVDYNKAISIEPTYATGYVNRGLAWEKKNDLQKALADFKKAVELNPSSQAGQQGLARVKKALGQ